MKWEPPTAAVRHPEAVWGDRANAALISAVFVEDHVGWEELPVRRLEVRSGGSDLFEVCCIPFYAEPENLGAILEVDPDNPGIVMNVLELGAEYDQPVRAVCAGDTRREFEAELARRGWPHERSGDLLAFSVPFARPWPASGEDHTRTTAIEELERTFAVPFDAGAIRWTT